MWNLNFVFPRAYLNTQGPGRVAMDSKKLEYDTTERTYGRVGWGGFSISMRAFCMAVAVVHLTLAITFGALIFINTDDSKVPKHLLIPITRNLGAWLNKSRAVDFPVPIGNSLKSECSLATMHDSRSPDFYIQPLSLYVMTYDTRCAIVLFHFLSFAFQMCNSCRHDSYYQTFKDGQTHLSHFLEYSISASVMITTMSVQLGVHDAYTLVGVFFNGWACMVFGFVAEILFQNNVPKIEILSFKFSPHWIAHIAGWITLVFAVAAAVSSLSAFLTCMDGVRLPDFVIPLITTEMLLFLSFGGVQIVDFLYKPAYVSTETDTNYEKRVRWAFRVELMYIILSLIAKSVLGFVVYFGS
jgi:hypothetical protein